LLGLQGKAKGFLRMSDPGGGQDSDLDKSGLEEADIDNSPMQQNDGIELEKERLRRQRMRSIAIAFGLVGLVVLFYAASIVRMGH